MIDQSDSLAPKLQAQTAGKLRSGDGSGVEMV